jgi:adenylosuccinate synthase
MADVIVGAQWGDEGKGKIVDNLSSQYDFCVRFNGGNNAGHTIINEFGELALHLIPAGIFHPHVTCVIGNGVVVNLASLWREYSEVVEHGVSVEHLSSNLKISSRAHVVMPWHIVFDTLQEKARGKEKIGTTSRGIGPVFTDKIARHGLRMGDLVSMKESDLRAWFYKEFYRNVEIVKSVYESIALGFSREIEEESGLSSADPHFRELLALRDVFVSYVCDSEELLWEAHEKGRRILLEGAQGIHLDTDFGTYPYVTSSPCTPAGALQGSGLPPQAVGRVIGVMKAYTTRVGTGPFPSEMDAETQSAIREKGKEFGATTGRPRRIGWLDLVILMHSARLGITEWAVTKGDILSVRNPIKVCYAYEDEKENPVSVFDMARACPVYTDVEGWGEDLEHSKEFNAYLQMIAQMTKVPVALVSTGPRREQIFTR